VALCTPEDVPGLTVLPMKSLPRNPADLLSSERMKTVVKTLRESFDFIIVDSPPVIAFALTLSHWRLFRRGDSGGPVWADNAASHHPGSWVNRRLEGEAGRCGPE